MRIAGLTYGVLAYLAFLAAFAWLLLFVDDVWLPRSVNVGSTVGGWQAVAIDIGLTAVFAVQHSVMARAAFKRRWTRLVPRLLERSTYVWATVVCVAIIVLGWQPWPRTLWHVDATPGRAAILLVQGLGLVLIVASTFAIDHFELFGLRQSWAYFRATEPAQVRFQTPFLYRIVRHPMQLGVVIVFWATPHLTAGHCVFAGAMTGYVLVGLWFEERDLARMFGDDYRDYKRRVPMLLPFSLFRRS